ncbi:hypothetical protein [Protaetiibacter mangrovi]|uniref:Uncharacterized protein n=1 Tax=Protaetiibacter mangrovi TaxID=2970926 RepID=A0ABT1ZF12_9MICO|nr:hypothetical protein [Protaetiibacter mangrovi]MCS0499280.1 hypothetical protein [Protaetiibacter mangrovi]TPX00591.1 hypothetical protein FJ656_32010 [Schumannella luteola]
MALFRRRGVDTNLPRDDRGFGSFDDYVYNLTPRNKRTTMVLANSNPYQDELRELVESGATGIETAISPRSIQAEGQDAPIEVRLFTGRRVSGPVGMVPRGLESVVDENLRRLDDRGVKVRIPVRIDRKREGYRVTLLMGALK